MSNINREYIKTLSKIVEKIKKLQEQLKDVSDIEKNLSFKNVVNSLEEFRKNIDVLKIVIDEELRTKTLKVEHSLENLEKKIFDNITGLKKEVEEIKFVWEKDKELGYKIQKSISEVIKEIKEELDNLKEKLKSYAEELKFTKEGLLKSPGIIGPSASGIEVLLNNQKKGVYSKLNFIEGTNITFDFSENKPEGKVNLTFNSTGGGNDGVISLNGLTGDIIIDGTLNQIEVFTSPNFIQISTPQDIHTEATPTFGGLILDSELILRGGNREIKFLELNINGENYVAFKAPDDIEKDIVWILPNSDGDPGQVLTTDGSGNLSWTTPSSKDAIIYAIALG